MMKSQTHMPLQVITKLLYLLCQGETFSKVTLASVAYAKLAALSIHRMQTHDQDYATVCVSLCE